MIRFGPWSTMLGLGAVFALAVAAALLADPASGAPTYGWPRCLSSWR